MENPIRAAELACYELFEGLREEQLERFLSEHSILRMPAEHQTIFEDDWSDGIFLIRTGIAKVRHITMAGEEVVIALLGAGQMFGELSYLLGDGRRRADVLSLTPMEVVKLRSSVVDNASRHLPDFWLRLARFEAQRLVQLGRRFGLQGEDATTRVLATLQELACCNSPDNDPQAPIPNLSQREIATIAGLARGTTSTVINQLRSRGTIAETPDGLRIVNLDPLRQRGLLRSEG
jgi:CRP-like cAMP-binding protein